MLASRTRPSVRFTAVRTYLTPHDAESVRAAGARRVVCADDCHLASRSHLRTRPSVRFTAGRTCLTPHDAERVRAAGARRVACADDCHLASRFFNCAPACSTFLLLFSVIGSCVLRATLRSEKKRDGLSVDTGANVKEAAVSSFLSIGKWVI